MDLQELNKIIRTNIIGLLDSSPGVSSMRNLSTCIDRSDNYIKKLIDGDFTPSLNTLLAIANYFDTPIQTLLVDSSSDTAIKLLIDDQLSSLSLQELQLVLSVAQQLNVSAKYSCGFPNTLFPSIIVGERFLDYFTTITEDRLWQLLAKLVFR